MNKLKHVPALYDATTHQFLDRLAIPPDTACLMVVTPLDGKLEIRDHHTLVNGVTIDYANDNNRH